MQAYGCCVLASVGLPFRYKQRPIYALGIGISFCLMLTLEYQGTSGVVYVPSAKVLRTE
jgi:hypothetical protein